MSLADISENCEQMLFGEKAWMRDFTAWLSLACFYKLKIFQIQNIFNKNFTYISAGWAGLDKKLINSPRVSGILQTVRI